MGRRVDGNLGGICGYAKSKYEKRVEEKRQQRSSSEPPSRHRGHGYGKLHKPPQVQALHERPRNRLRKHASLPLPASQPVTAMYILEYEPYPQNTQLRKVLGVFSTFDAVTLGAFKHGAYAFSKEGMLDGTEYLSSTGRIRIVQATVQRSGVKAFVPERSRSLNDEHIRLDIPHPQSQEGRQSSQPKEEHIAKEVVFLAIREGPNSASWIGVFQDKGLAWGGCLKDKSMCALSDTLSEETRTVGFNNMPQLSGRLAQSGRHKWTVVEYIIDSPI